MILIYIPFLWNRGDSLIEACFTVFTVSQRPHWYLLTVWSLWGNPELAKGGFKSKDTGEFFHCQNKYSKTLSWAENLNFPPKTVNSLFKNFAQDSDLEYLSLFWLKATSLMFKEFIGIFSQGRWKLLEFGLASTYYIFKLGPFEFLEAESAERSKREVLSKGLRSKQSYDHML